MVRIVALELGTYTLMLRSQKLAVSHQTIERFHLLGETIILLIHQEIARSSVIQHRLRLLSYSAVFVNG